MEKRPKHCKKVDLWAQVLSKSLKELSPKYLVNCEKFFISAPKMSPPTCSLSDPNDVQECTRHYMAQYLESLPTDYENCPKKWLMDRTPKNLSNEVIEVPREAIAMSSGNTGQLIITHETKCLEQHASQRTQMHNTVQFKTKVNVAPNVETAFRLYPERGGRLCMALPKTISQASKAYATHVVLSLKLLIHFFIPKETKLGK